MNRLHKFFFILLICFLLLVGCSTNSYSETSSVKLDPNNPITITLWHCYNFSQQDAFDQLVDEFNNTVGIEKGIVIDAISQGSIIDITTNVQNAANKKVGASDIPNIFASYADTAYEIDQLGIVADLTPYFSNEELSTYIDGYIEEGRFSSEDSLKLFPIAKATEVLILNETDWIPFAKATGANKNNLQTFEGIVKIAETYYEWTDSQTTELNDGRAFFGRDALANYIYIGAMQLGSELFSVDNGKTSLNFDKTVIRKLWDNYYIPYIKGYFLANGRFRCDNMKTGELLAYIGSSAGATYIPNEIIIEDKKVYYIKTGIYSSPIFEGGELYAVQQGAGMVVTNSSEKEVYASVQFLKWITMRDHNLNFSIHSTYLPVTKKAVEKESFTLALKTSNLSTTTKAALLVAADMVNHYQLYSQKAFENSFEIRNFLDCTLAEIAELDAATVRKNLKKGMTREDALAPFESDEYFDNWYEQTRQSLEELMN